MDSVFASRNHSVDQEVVFLDNASSDESLKFVKEKYSQIHSIRSEENLGFAGGNNLAWDYIKENLSNCEFVVLLNPDTIVTDGWLDELADIFRDDRSTGIVQSKLLLWPDKHKINSIGNSSHFLGYGFVNGLGLEDTGKFDETSEIGFASGAACMISCKILDQLGLFDPEFFMYCEDTDLSWKIRLAGYTVKLAPKSIVYHKYSFQKNYRFYYYLERNRSILVFSYYRIWTLFLIAAMMLLMEAGQWYFAFANKVAKQKFKAMCFFLRPSSLGHLLKRRKHIQQFRKISDRRFTEMLVSEIKFNEIQSPLLKYIANPIMKSYWTCIRSLIF